jgi:heptosyltransferase-2
LEPGGVLVVQTSFIGDMVLTTPLIAYLHERDNLVDVLAIPSTAPLLANHPHVRDVVVFDKRGADSGARGFVRLAKDLRERRYGKAYFAQGSVRSAALGFAARIPERVGFETSAGRRFYTVRRPYDESAHHSQRLFSLVADTAAPAPRLYPGKVERAMVDALFSSAGHDGGPVVALAPGSVWATKRWPFYPELAELLSSSFRILIVGGKDDIGLAAQIRQSVPSAIDATDKLSLLAAAEAIRRCAAIVTNDSAPQHLASAVGTPTVTIFGPTVPEFGFGPLAPRHDVLGHDGLACRPCDRHGPQRCPLGHWKCMRELEAVMVREAVLRILSGNRDQGSGTSG